MTTFDAVTREVCVARREATVTPLQSLVLLNDPQFVEASRTLAERVLDAPSSERARSASRRVSRAHRPVPRRDARPRSWSRCSTSSTRLFARHPADALKYVRVGDSAPDPSLAAADPAALAATTAVVNALINFDEFVVLR